MHMKMVLYLLRLSFRVALFDITRNLFYAECLFDLAQLHFFFGVSFSLRQSIKIAVYIFLPYTQVIWCHGVIVQ